MSMLYTTTVALLTVVSVIFVFQKLLRFQLINLGDVEHGVDDVIGLLNQTESDLLEMEDICCDPNVVETHLRRIQVLYSVC